MLLKMRRVPEEAVFDTARIFRTVEACFEHGELLKVRRVPQEAVLRTECPFRTVGGRFRYRMPQTVKMRKGIRGSDPRCSKLRYAIHVTSRRFCPECLSRIGHSVL